MQLSDSTGLWGLRCRGFGFVRKGIGFKRFRFPVGAWRWFWLPKFRLHFKIEATIGLDPVWVKRTVILLALTGHDLANMHMLHVM